MSISHKSKKTKAKHNKMPKSDNQSTGLKKRRPQKYNMYDEDFRKKAVDDVEEIGFIAAMAKHNIHRKKLIRWLETQGKRRKGAGKKIQNTDMEAQLIPWITNFFFEKNRYPQRNQIKEKAFSLSTNPAFKASKGWLDKFIKRNNFNF